MTVFLKYLLYDKAFTTAEHEKAWLIRVAVNACKDHLKSFFRRKTVPLEVLAEEADYINEEQRSTLHSVLSLPDKYRDVIYLHYYEGYIRGGCSPLAAKKDYPVFLDEHAILWEQIYISAGQRGVQLRLSPDDLCRATGATMAEIANNAD